MKIDLLITNCTLLPCPGKDAVIAPGFIAISGTRIARIGPMAECPPSESGTGIDGHGQLALPGLVNGHCHAPMTLFRGMADDLALTTWLHDHIFPAEARWVNPEMVYWCARLAAAEMLLGGITTVADGYFLEEEVARACADTGLRCIAAQGIIDFPAPGVPDPSRNIEVAQRFLDQWQDRDPLIRPAVFAHAPYTCANQTLVRAKELSRRYQAPLFLHVAETRNEIEQIASPLAPTPIRHLEALGLLDPDTVCVHCVWADDQDLDILAERGAGVILCPQSNLKLASGRAPLLGMLNRQIRVGLGTDGAASNNSLDLFREMDLAAKVQKVSPCDPVAVPARRILEIATSGGASVLGCSGDHGQLAPGAPADLILINPQQPHLQPFYNPDLLVYSAGAGDVQTVIVNGRLVVQNREIRTIDLEDTMRQVRRLAARL
jgi:5-methylthioadenosine/S-adenosylhomocysteine deaminase